MGCEVDGMMRVFREVLVGFREVSPDVRLSDGIPEASSLPHCS